MMIKKLPELAQQFLHSELDQQQSRNHKHVVKCTQPFRPILNFDSQQEIAAKIASELKSARQSKDNSVNYIFLKGPHGIGKTTVLNNIVSIIIGQKIASEEEISWFSLKSHHSIYSLYSYCSKLASNKNLKQEFSILEELEGKKERKDQSILTVFKQFQIICIDDIDADNFQIWKHLTSLLRNKFDRNLVIIATFSKSFHTDAPLKKQ